jgi:TonB family protein
VTPESSGALRQRRAGATRQPPVSGVLSAGSLRVALILIGVFAGHLALADGPDALGGPPPFKLEMAHSYYPAAAKQRGLTGRVGLTCTIDAKGHAGNIVVVESAGKILDESARQLLADERFELPADWVKSGGPARTYAFGVIFQLSDKPKVAAFDDDRPTIIVTAQALPSV